MDLTAVGRKVFQSICPGVYDPALSVRWQWLQLGVLGLG